MEHLFANTWVYVGHDSQVPNAGDYFGTTIGTQPVLMVRHTDGTVHVLHNRCPHKGTRITTETCGNTGKFFRCPYHAWSFRTDGSLLAIPLSKGYENTGFEQSHAAQGHERRSAMSTTIAASCSPSSTMAAPASRSSSAKACRASTTWSTARRPASSRSPAACCATCTIAIGRCWSRTRPTPAIRWWRTNPRPAPRSRSGRTRRPAPRSRWRSRSTRRS